jgi:hypothetical protein
MTKYPKMQGTEQKVIQYALEVLANECRKLAFRLDRVNYVKAQIVGQPVGHFALIAQPLSLTIPNVQIGFDKSGYTVTEHELQRAVYPQLVYRITTGPVGPVSSEGSDTMQPQYNPWTDLPNNRGER